MLLLLLFCLWVNLEHFFGQSPVILLGNLRFIGGPVKDRRVVIHVVDVDHDLRVVLVKIVRGNQTKLVLEKWMRVITLDSEIEFSKLS